MGTSVRNEPLRKFINSLVIAGDDKKHLGVMGASEEGCLLPWQAQGKLPLPFSLKPKQPPLEHFGREH